MVVQMGMIKMMYMQQGDFFNSKVGNAEMDTENLMGLKHIFLVLFIFPSIQTQSKIVINKNNTKFPVL